MGTDINKKDKIIEETQLKLEQQEIFIKALSNELDSAKLQVEESKKQTMNVVSEKESLIKQLENLEQTIVQREKSAFSQQYEKILIETCDKIKMEETTKFRQLLIEESAKLKDKYEREIQKLKQDQEACVKNVLEQQKLIFEEKHVNVKNEIEKESISRIEAFNIEKESLKNRLNE